MSLPDDAIVFQSVCKTYGLHTSKWEMVREALGFKNKIPPQQFHALKNINLNIKKGERIGLVGRNGAGKSTLLKLITRNFEQTTGSIVVNGVVQALMNTGIGFHPEFTGLENIKASLLYNGLSKAQFDEAVADVIDFVELGEFLDQPLKVYSLGMQSRLFFAVATAVQPEILIVDEVLGAGDAYFSAKSADRMKKLTSSGCTLILVSHSTQQVLQFCEYAYWLESGEIVMQGAAIDIIKAYEAYTKKLEMEAISKSSLQPIKTQSVIQSKWLREKLLQEILQTHQASPKDQNTSSLFDSTQKVGISRWPSMEPGLKISDIRVLTDFGEIINQVVTNQALNIEVSILAEAEGKYDVYYVIVLFTEDGRWLTRHVSPLQQLALNEGESTSIQLQYERVLLGNGKYMFSAAIYNILDLNDLSTARYYDLLSRSFEFKVVSEYGDDASLFHHPAKWERILDSYSRPVIKNQDHIMIEG